jgi:type II secretory pathway pseudopilin PulG
MTLVEMLIAIGITAIVMTMSVSIFVSQFGSYNRAKNVKESQRSAQEVLGLIRSELLEAGWSVLPEMAFSFQDGSITGTGADMIVVNDVRLITLVNSSNVKYMRSLLMTEDCPGGAPITGGQGTASITVQTVDMDNDGNPDFSSVGGSRYVIFDSDVPKTAVMTSVAGNAITLSAASALNAKFVAPGIYYCVDDTTNPQCLPASTIRYVLRRSDRESFGLQPMAENMIDLQVAYKDNNDAACNMATQILCDASPGCEWFNGRCTGYWYGKRSCAGQGSGPGNFCALSPFKPEQISLVRLTVVTRSSNVVDASRTNPSYCRPAVENRNAAAVGSADCGFLYRTYSTVIQPRGNR